MFYRPYSKTVNDSYREVPKTNSYIRFFNSSPNSPALDVYVNGQLFAKNLAYKQFTDYFAVASGNYNIKIYTTGKTTKPLLDSAVSVPDYWILNICIIGVFPNISLYPIPEPNSAQNSGSSCFRFINLSPSSPAIDVYLSDGKKVFSNVGYKDITNYACVPPGTYSFSITAANTKEILFTLQKVELSPNNYYAMYAVGTTNGTNPFEVILANEPR